MNFRVWAPQARTVALAVGGTQIPMTARADGWWTAEAVFAAPGTDYAFRLDGGPPLPDPRSVR
jgi:maltooligosyltrehalose trehalohydrolase